MRQGTKNTFCCLFVWEHNCEGKDVDVVIGSSRGNCLIRQDCRTRPMHGSFLLQYRELHLNFAIADL
jgi:hypothetical protein